MFFGGLALLAAFLSIRDAFKARAGKLDEMTLQLPGFLKDRIRSVVRTGAKARNFVIAAFVAGILISFLELACTGQVYAPIIYSIQQGRKDAVMWLLAYNLAFIIPLVVIFLMAFAGMSNKVLDQLPDQAHLRREARARRGLHRAGLGDPVRHEVLPRLGPPGARATGPRSGPFCPQWGEVRIAPWTHAYPRHRKRSAAGVASAGRGSAPPAGPS